MTTNTNANGAPCCEPVYDVVPLKVWRHVKVTDRHTASNAYDVLQEISDDDFPDADLIDVASRQPAISRESLYQAFPAPGSSPPRPALRMGVHTQAWLVAPSAE